MTDDLVTWLRTHLDEDERVAREADPEPTAEDLEFGDSPSAWTDPNEFQDRGGPVFAHVLRLSPARVLAELDAKRRIVELHRPMRTRSTGSAGGFIEDCRTCDQFPAQYPCGTMRLLALPYAARPGYRTEWGLQ